MSDEEEDDDAAGAQVEEAEDDAVVAVPHPVKGQAEPKRCFTHQANVQN